MGLFYTAPEPFLPPNQQRQSTEGTGNDNVWLVDKAAFATSNNHWVFHLQYVHNAACTPNVLDNTVRHTKLTISTPPLVRQQQYIASIHPDSAGNNSSHETSPSSASYISWQCDTAHITAERPVADWYLLPAGLTAANPLQRHAVDEQWDGQYRPPTGHPAANLPHTAVAVDRWDKQTDSRCSIT